jgi:hypothetical protein
MTAIDKLRLKVGLARIWVPPYVRVNADGDLEKVDGYWRKVKGPSKPKASPPVQRAVPDPAVVEHFKPKNLMGLIASESEAIALVKEHLGSWEYEQNPSGLDWGQVSADAYGSDLMKPVLSMLADQEFRTKLKEYEAMFASVKDEWSMLPAEHGVATAKDLKYAKIRAGKNRERMAVLVRASQLAARLQSGKIKSEEVSTELAELKKVMAGPTGNKKFTKNYSTFEPNKWYALLEAQGNKYIQEKGVNDLPFLIDTYDQGELPEKLIWLHDKYPEADKFIAALPEVSLNSVILNSLLNNDDAVDNLLNSAKLIHALDLADMHAKNKEWKEETSPTNPKQQEWEKLADIKSKKHALLSGGLKQGYYGYKNKEDVGNILKPDIALIQDHTDDWHYHDFVDGKLGYKSPEPLLDDEAAEEIASGGYGDYYWWSAETSPKALTKHQKEVATATNLDWDNIVGSVNPFIKERGGNYLAKMNKEEKREWVMAYLAGNQLMLWNIENAAATKTTGKGTKPWTHKLKLSHPGSPDSPVGKTAHQTFANLVAISSWGEPYKTHQAPTTEQAQQMITDLGMVEGYWAAQNISPKIEDDGTVSLDGLEYQDYSLMWDELVKLIPPESLPEADPELVPSNKAEQVEPEPQMPIPDAVSGPTWKWLNDMEKLGDPADDPDAKDIWEVVAPESMQWDIPILREALKDEASYKYDENAKAQIDVAPVNVLLAAAWANGMTAGGALAPSDLGLAIKARFDANYYKPKDANETAAQIATNGAIEAVDANTGMHFIHPLEPGDKVYVITGDKDWVGIDHADGTISVYSPLKKASHFIPEGGLPTWVTNPSATNYEPYVQQKQMDLPPVPVTASQAKAAGLKTGVNDDYWNKAHDLVAGIMNATFKAWPKDGEGESVQNYSVHEVDNVLSHIPGLSDEFKSGAPLDAKLAVVVLYTTKLHEPAAFPEYIDAAISIIDWSYKNGTYGIKIPTIYIHPAKNYAAQIAKGNVTPEAIAGQWSIQQENQFAADFNLDTDGLSTAEIAHAIADVLAQKTSATATTSKAAPESWPKSMTFNGTVVQVGENDTVWQHTSGSIIVWNTAAQGFVIGVTKEGTKYTPTSFEAHAAFKANQNEFAFEESDGTWHKIDSPEVLGQAAKTSPVVSLHGYDFIISPGWSVWQREDGAYLVIGPTYQESKLVSPPSILDENVGSVGSSVYAAAKSNLGSGSFVSPSTGKTYTLMDLADLPSPDGGVLGTPQEEAPVVKPSKPKPPTGLPVEKKLVLTPLPGQEPKKGGHAKGLFQDQDGGKWMAKPYLSDPYPLMRVEQEVYAAQIGQVLGFKHPDVQLQDADFSAFPNIKKNKAKTYLQFFADFTGSLSGKSIPSLSDDALIQLAEHHLLDWLISNHDTHDDNLMIDADGNIHAIDKGQAWKGFPSDKLAIGYTLGYEPVVYDDLYNGIQSHAISEERANKILVALMKKARQMEKNHDPQVRALLEKAFAHRPESTMNGMSKEQFIDAVMDRKHSIVADFTTFYQSIYKNAGYEWPESELAAQGAQIDLPDGRSVFAGVSQDLIDETAKAKVHGKTTFFGGTDLEDSHMLMWEEKAKDGTRIFYGEARLREAADGRVVDWINDHTIENETGQLGKKSAQPMAAPGAVPLPKNDPWWEVVINAAKTVNHHSGDGEYNMTHYNGMLEIEEQIYSARLAIDEAMKGKSVKNGEFISSPITPSGWTTGLKFTDSEQQAAWLQMTEHYLAIIKEIKEGFENKTKTASNPSIGGAGYTKFEYIPKPKPVVTDEWASHDEEHHLKLYENGVWELMETGTGIGKTLTKAEADKLLKSGVYVKADELDVTVGGQDVKVYKRDNSREEGQFLPDTGELLAQGGEFKEGSPGYEYDIEVGNDMQIEYRPHQGLSVAKTQRGLLRIKIKKFTGDEASVRSLIDLLSQMGVDMTPAEQIDLELFYWRHMSGIAGDRIGYNSGKQGALVQAVKTFYVQNPNASKEEELAFLRAEWAKFIGKAKVEQADVYPHFMHTRLLDPEMETSRPYWLRPDGDDAKIRTVSHNITVGYGGTVSISKGERGKLIVQSGSLYASEERLRMFGQWVYGMSSGPDQGHGSAHYMFLHPNNGGSSIVIRPEVWLRTHNYIFSGDHYGEVNDRKHHAPYSLPKMLAKTHGELMVKYGISLLDDIIVMKIDQPEYAQTIKWLKDHGITEIRGVPIEKRIVTSGTISALAQDVIAEAKKAGYDN